MNYETLSDFEINKAVAKMQWPDLTPLSKLDSSNARGDDNEVHFLRFGFYLDYCNNPSDAWPIIFESKIHIGWSYDDMWRAEITNQGQAGPFRKEEATDSNPLRAAMIVYLKMNLTKEVTQ